MPDERHAAILQAYPDLFGSNPWGVQLSAMSFQFDFGEGWRSILIDLLEELRGIVHEEGIDDFRIQQVREKRAALLVYIRPMPLRVRDAINRARDRSMVTCEWCGAPGETGKNHG